MIASKQAFEDSNLQTEELDAHRFGVILSSGIGGLQTIEEEKEKGMKRIRTCLTILHSNGYRKLSSR